MEGEELAKLLGREHRYRILLELYPDERYYVSEFANLLKPLDRRNLARYLEQLEEVGLVRSIEERRKGAGKPRKYYSLADSGRSIIAAFIGVTKEKKKEKPEEWQIDKILELLDDPAVSAGIREFAAHRFSAICREDPIPLTGKKKVQEIFEAIGAKPTQYEEVVVKSLRNAISSSFPRILRDKERGKWALEKLYPLLVQCLEDSKEDEKLRVWALKRIGDVGRVSMNLQMQKKAREKIFEMYFSKETDPESACARVAKQELVWITSRDLFEKVHKRAKSKDSLEKAKAELLLQDMMREFGFRQTVRIF